MHDITNLETMGIPGAFVASTEFETAADAQSASLGFHPRAIFVQHPIQDRTDEELHALAETAIDEIVAGISSPPPEDAE